MNVEDRFKPEFYFRNMVAGIDDRFIEMTRKNPDEFLQYFYCFQESIDVPAYILANLKIFNQDALWRRLFETGYFKEREAKKCEIFLRIAYSEKKQAELLLYFSRRIQDRDTDEATAQQIRQLKGQLLFAAAENVKRLETQRAGKKNIDELLYLRQYFCQAVPSHEELFSPSMFRERILARYLITQIDQLIQQGMNAKEISPEEIARKLPDAWHTEGFLCGQEIRDAFLNTHSMDELLERHRQLMKISRYRTLITLSVFRSAEEFYEFLRRPDLALCEQETFWEDAFHSLKIWINTEAQKEYLRFVYANLEELHYEHFYIYLRKPEILKLEEWSLLKAKAAKLFKQNPRNKWYQYFLTEEKLV